MTPQIKQRIEQIQRGEVPEGYKRTKAGVVPNEWNEECLGKYLQEYKELSNDIERYPVILHRDKVLFRNLNTMIIAKL